MALRKQDTTGVGTPHPWEPPGEETVEVFVNLVTALTLLSEKLMSDVRVQTLALPLCLNIHGLNKDLRCVTQELFRDYPYSGLGLDRTQVPELSEKNQTGLISDFSSPMQPDGRGGPRIVDR